MKNIQEICRERKEEIRWTAQMVSDESGVPFSTVNNFFCNTHRKPTLDTTGMICQVLGVSLDRYFNIQPPDNELSGVEQALIEKELANEKEKVSLLCSFIRQKNRVIYLLIGLCAVLSGLLAVYVVIDAQASDVGLIQGGNPAPTAWLIIIAVIVALVILCTVFVNISWHKEDT